MIISILLKFGVNFHKTLHTILIVKKQILQKEILEVINSFLIIIYILFQIIKCLFISVKVTPLTTRLHYHWYIDHYNALQLFTIQLGQTVSNITQWRIQDSKTWHHYLAKYSPKMK